MLPKWPLVQIGEIADSISDTHRLGKKELIFLNTSDVMEGKILHSEYSLVAGWPGQAKKSIKKDDILFSEIRPANGRYAYVDVEAQDYVVSTKLMVIRAREQVHPRFLFHFLTSKKVTSWLQHLAESRSGTFPQITFDQVAELELNLPPRNIQAAIVVFMDSFGDKIELNRCMNETLESIAFALFKSWFLDFDPVRAKTVRRDTGLPKSISDLFPSSFEDSELGPIPKGWKVGPIGDLTDVVGGSTPSTQEASFWQDGVHSWATPKDLSALNTPVLLDTERRITPSGLSQIGSGLLPEGTVLLSSRAPIGYLAIAEVPVAINQGFIAMKPKPGVSNLFLLRWAALAHDLIVSRANGSTFLEISKANFRPLLVVTPPLDIIAAFDRQTRPLYRRVVECENESQTLRNLRDTLLPKLISGTLLIKDAARAVEGLD